ncbi:hypothetical protein LEN26_021266 [Aphanomyces euteiches]|nr:hypothetical protein LEN26_021266 [Aphanomyces euteiches]
MQGRRRQKNHRQQSEVHDSRLKLYRTYTPRPADVLDTQPPVDFDEEMYLPEDSFEPGESFMEIFGVRDIRYTRSKEFEVQTEKNGPWSWIAASLLPASELLTSFEKDWLRVSRLGMMVDDDMNFEEDEIVEEKQDESPPPPDDDVRLN